MLKCKAEGISSLNQEIFIQTEIIKVGLLLQLNKKNTMASHGALINLIQLKKNKRIKRLRVFVILSGVGGLHINTGKTDLPF